MCLIVEFCIVWHESKGNILFEFIHNTEQTRRNIISYVYLSCMDARYINLCKINTYI